MRDQKQSRLSAKRGSDNISTSITRQDMAQTATGEVAMRTYFTACTALSFWTKCRRPCNWYLPKLLMYKNLPKYGNSLQNRGTVSRY
jgi:hypothetical protein